MEERSTTTDTARLEPLYTSLPLRKGAKTIRVFHLNPVDPISPDAPIHGTLEVVDLNARPQYVALSYVWGPWSRPPRTIFCGQHQVDVTDNLWEALSHLRRDPTGEDPGRSSDGSMTIWIDALCINQRDAEEKMAQIPLMGDIYSSSFSTCIWLGKGSPESDEAARLAKAVGWQELFHPEGGFFYTMPNRSVTWKAGLRGALARIRNSFWEIDAQPTASGGSGSFRDVNGRISRDEINLVFSNVWLRRIWTLQEVALAPNPWIRYGSQCLTWRTMLYSVAYLSWGERNSVEYGFTGTLYQSWQRAMDLWFTINQPPRQEPISYQPAQGTVSTSNFELAMADYHRFLSQVKTISWQILYIVIFLPFVLIGVVIMIVVNANPGISATGIVVARIVLGVWLAGLCLSMVFGRFIRPHSDVRSNQTVLGAVVQEIWRREATEPQDKACGVHAVLGRLGIQLQPPEKSSTRGLLYRELVSSSSNFYTVPEI